MCSRSFPSTAYTCGSRARCRRHDVVVVVVPVVIEVMPSIVGCASWVRFKIARKLQSNTPPTFHMALPSALLTGSEMLESRYPSKRCK